MLTNINMELPALGGGLLKELLGNAEDWNPNDPEYSLLFLNWLLDQHNRRGVTNAK